MRYRLHLIQQKEVFVSTLQTHLETYLSSDAPALGLEEIALKYNVDPKQYYRYFPELAHQVSQRYLQFKSEKSADDHSLRTETTKRTPRKIDYALVKKVLEKALITDPPKSLCHIARESGYSTRLLNRFRDLCEQILERRSEYLLACQAVKIQQDCELIRGVVNQLHHEAIRLSYKRVIERTRPSIFTRPECREAYQKAVDNLHAELSIKA